MQCPHCGQEVQPEQTRVLTPADAEAPGDPPEPFPFKRQECPSCHAWLGDEQLPAA